MKKRNRKRSIDNKVVGIWEIIIEDGIVVYRIDRGKGDERDFYFSLEKININGDSIKRIEEGAYPIFPKDINAFMNGIDEGIVKLNGKEYKIKEKRYYEIPK